MTKQGDGVEEIGRKDAIRAYIWAEPRDVAELREVPMGAFPWPAQDNPMIAQLLDRAKQEFDHETGLIWLVVHAWFEGALAAMSRASNDDRRANSRGPEEIEAIAQFMGVTTQTAKKHAKMYDEWDRERRAAWIEGKAQETDGIATVTALVPERPKDPKTVEEAERRLSELLEVDLANEKPESRTALDHLPDEQEGENLTEAAENLIEVALLVGDGRKRVREPKAFRKLVRAAARNRGVRIRTQVYRDMVVAFPVDHEQNPAAKELGDRKLRESMSRMTEGLSERVTQRANERARELEEEARKVEKFIEETPEREAAERAEREAWAIRRANLPRERVKKYACPTCGAGVGEPCHAIEGRHEVPAHGARKRLMKEAEQQ